MRVLQINRNDFVDGGADRVFLNTIALLQHSELSPSLVEGGVGVGMFEVDTFTRQDVGLDPKVNPRKLSIIAKLRLIFPYLYNRKVASALTKKISEFHPDIAHIHLIFGTLSVSVLKTLKRHKVSVVMTLHDYRLICPANAMLDRHGKVCEKCTGSRYYNCLINRCSEGNLFHSAVIMLEAYIRKYLYRPLKLVDHFIFVSQFARHKHLESEPRYALKSSHLYNFHNHLNETPTIRGDYFLYYGRISQEKGILTLIEAALRTSIRLIIAGSGPQEEEILERLRDFEEARLRDRGTERPRDLATIEFVGFKSGADLELLIRNSEFVIVPSQWYENNPMSIVESFSMGKPVIGSRIGGIPELVTPETGFLFEVGNTNSLMEAIAKAQHLSAEDYERMSQSCRDFANKHFNQHLHLEQLTRIYQNVVKKA